jgi:hypothetical protein
MEKFGSGINIIQDLQHCLKANISSIATIKFKLYILFLTCRISKLKLISAEDSSGSRRVEIWLLRDEEKS